MTRAVIERLRNWWNQDLGNMGAMWDEDENGKPVAVDPLPTDQAAVEREHLARVDRAIRDGWWRSFWRKEYGL